MEITKEILDRICHYLRLGYVAFKKANLKGDIK